MGRNTPPRQGARGIAKTRPMMQGPCPDRWTEGTNGTQRRLPLRTTPRPSPAPPPPRERNAGRELTGASLRDCDGRRRRLFPAAPGARPLDPRLSTRRRGSHHRPRSRARSGGTALADRQGGTAGGPRLGPSLRPADAGVFQGDGVAPPSPTPCSRRHRHPVAGRRLLGAGLVGNRAAAGRCGGDRLRHRAGARPRLHALLRRRALRPSPP